MNLGQIVIEQRNQAAAHDVAPGPVRHTAHIKGGTEKILDRADIVAAQGVRDFLLIAALGHGQEPPVRSFPVLIELRQDILQLPELLPGHWL